MSFPKPFDLTDYQVKFDISGGDLADVYYLTGLALPNTPSYHLSADLHHSGTVFRMSDLAGRLGSSDIEGEVEIQTSADRPRFIAKLKSRTLDIVDAAPTLGHPSGKSNSLSGARGPTAGAAAAQMLFPDADLQLDRVRGMDADVTYQAASVTAPKVPLSEVNFHLMLDRGVLRLDPLSFVFDKGNFAGSVRIDARKDDPESDIDMRIDDVDLSQFKSATATQAPLQGSLVGRLQVHGYGSSIHKLASTADGSLRMAVPHGNISNTLAELTGIDVLNGLGLLGSRRQNQTEIRCGVADFQAQEGVLQSRTVFIDTTNVLITGRGSIHLDNEHLDLALQGDPKKLRLMRIRSPITLHGTLLHPAIGLKADKLLTQAGVAAALGTLLTPVAAALAFIDPGLAKSKDCAAVLAQAENDASRARAPVGALPPGVGGSSAARSGP